MKIRNGFVSNSSSSSFVMMGAVIVADSNVEKQIMKMLNYDYNADLAKFKQTYYPDSAIDDEMISEFFHEEVTDRVSAIKDLKIIYDGSHCKGKGILIGKELVEVNDYGMESVSYSTDQLEDATKEVRKILGDDVEIKLYCGTYAC